MRRHPGRLEGQDHARTAGGRQLRPDGLDNHPAYPYEGIKGCSISLNVDSKAEAERLFNALAEGGSVQMPLGPTFWAASFGMFTDRFGVAWMVNCEQDR